jgi:phosphate starvation-inducible PhoH-like protein
MSRGKGQHKREARQQRRNANRHPELVAVRDDFEAKIEHEMSRIIFGPLQAQNEAQGQMISTIKSKRVTFVTGPAGTGKTFVATSLAAEMLEAGEIERLVIARPMVGCEEEIGFLPGTEQEKYAPWLDPFMDVLEGKLGKKKVETYFKYGKIVAKPLMMMRGSTFRNAFVILDEAQNTTEGQMKMFLTRLGAGSRVVVDGDVEQTDLPAGKKSGLVDALARFRGKSSFGVVEFTEDDIQRDPLVREIVKGYRKAA